jgi:hypothetical protein
MLLMAFDAMRGERVVPSRQDLDLRQVRRLVPCLFIAEQDAPSRDFRFRLAGTAVSALLGGEVTGLAVTDGWSRSDGEGLRSFLAGITGTQRPALLRIRFMTDRGQWLTAEMAGVPLLAADGRSLQVLGGLFAFPDPELRHYDRITGRELPKAGMARGGTPAASAGGGRRFRVIDGGLAQG